MKTIFKLSAAALCLAATPALADDGEWTGAYVGASVGYSSTKSDTSVALGGNWTTEAANLQTFVASSAGTKQSFGKLNYGIQAGYNQEVSGMVVGVEAEYAVLTGQDVVVRGPLTSPFPPLTYTFTNRVDPKSMFAAKAKAGLPFGKTMVYAEGGLAIVRTGLGLDVLSSANYKKTSMVTKSLTGFTLGGGIEHKLTSNISARISYNYVDAGKDTYNTFYGIGSAFVTPAYTETVTQTYKMHMVRVGFNVHF